MARMPGARWLGEHSPKNRMTRYDIVCVHTIVGRAPAHAAHFSTHGDGRIDQSRDTAFQSAANLDGNPRIIAVENEDMGPDFGPWPNDVTAPPLTPEQVEANAQILAWAHRVHGVPLQLCPNSKPGSRGLAYHRQGIDGNFGPFKYPGRVKGGELWTEHFGKVCPTDPRIDQRPAILARAIEIVNGDDMPSAKEIADAVWAHPKSITQPRRAVLESPLGTSGKSLTTITLGQVAELGALRATVAQLAKGQALTPAQITAAAEAGAQKALDKTIDEAHVELVVEDDGA